jgi:hypothetical protein
MSIKFTSKTDGTERTYGASFEADGKTPKAEEVCFKKDTKPGFILRLGPTMGQEPDYELRFGLMSAIWIYTTLRNVFARSPAYIATAAAFTDPALDCPGVPEEERMKIKVSAAIKMLQDLQPGTSANEAADLILMEAMVTSAMVGSAEIAARDLVVAPVSDDAENDGDEDESDDDEE